MVVGNDHFCDTAKKASQRLIPHIKGEIPLYHRRANKPLDSTTLVKNRYLSFVWEPWSMETWTKAFETSRERRMGKWTNPNTKDAEGPFKSSGGFLIGRGMWE